MSVLQLAPLVARSVVVRVGDRRAGAAVSIVRHVVEYVRHARKVPGMQPSVGVDAVPAMPAVVAPRRMVRRAQDVNDWLTLLAPIPPGVKPECKPVASAEMLANGTAGPIAGWHSLSVHLSDPHGSRHVLITIDEHGRVLSAGDHVMRIRAVAPSGEITMADHESIGGRYDDHGVFFGTRWINRIECEEGQDEGAMTGATKSEPSEREVALLGALVGNLMTRL